MFESRPRHVESPRWYTLVGILKKVSRQTEMKISTLTAEVGRLKKDEDTNRASTDKLTATNRYPPKTIDNNCPCGDAFSHLQHAKERVNWHPNHFPRTPEHLLLMYRWLFIHFLLAILCLLFCTCAPKSGISTISYRISLMISSSSNRQPRLIPNE